MLRQLFIPLPAPNSPSKIRPMNELLKLLISALAAVLTLTVAVRRKAPECPT